MNLFRSSIRTKLEKKRKKEDRLSTQNLTILNVSRWISTQGACGSSLDVTSLNSK